MLGNNIVQIFVVSPCVASLMCDCLSRQASFAHQRINATWGKQKIVHVIEQRYNALFLILFVFLFLQSYAEYDFL